jgi:hypothetical protein
MPEDDDLDRRGRKLPVEPAEARWLTLRPDGDVRELRDALRAVQVTQQEHPRRFDSIGARFDSVETTRQEHGERFDAAHPHLEPAQTHPPSAGWMMR